MQRVFNWGWIILLSTIVFTSYSQVLPSDSLRPFGSNLKAYSWDKNPSLSILSKDDQKEDAVVIKEVRILDFEQNNNQLLLNYTLHKRVRVSNEKAIAEFSRVYIPISNIQGEIDLSVRTIQANGKVILLDKSKIKELKNVEEAGDFTIFAFEGVEPGCEVEYLLKYTKPATVVGREMLQTEYKKLNSMIYVEIPETFFFQPVFYNCNYSFYRKEIEFKNCFFTGSLSVPKLKEETMAYYTSHLARFDYSIKSKYASKDMSWKEMSKTVMNRLLPAYNSKIEKLSKSLGIFEKTGTADKIQAIENYIKNNIALTGNVAEESVSSILKNKFASESGLIQLYMAFFKHAEIDYQLVYTTDRTRSNFDGEHPSWFFLEQTLFYFPSTKHYLSPTSIYLRYPMFPTSWALNQGLFINVIQKKKTPKDQIVMEERLDTIAPLSYDYNFSKLDIKTSFDLEKESVRLELMESFGGEPAIYYQPYFGLVEESKQKEIINSILKKPSEEGTPEKGEVLGYDRNISPAIKPFDVKGILNSTQLLQRAGGKFIFNIGDVIGPQSEWYADTMKRVLPITPRYGHFYIRSISIEIPEGYQVKNLEKLIMDVNMAYKDDPKSCYFSSKYVLEGSKLKIRVEEYYKLPEYPASTYEAFRKVINAAADFNKITLLLEKK
ncbi:MAG: DUF3857 domain-containing protein [Cytophagaceae bacterium]|jgi:hypothetical protein|nr:DUF3857 domain-containing protein [Cytophagaceae bacterium]